MSTFCKDNNIEIIDPLKEMRKDLKKEAIFNDGVHLSKYGHAFIADFIVRKLQNGYLEQP
jgi:hypothetical protein